MTVTFTNGTTSLSVPGYFAADDASETSATSEPSGGPSQSAAHR